MMSKDSRLIRHKIIFEVFQQCDQLIIVPQCHRRTDGQLAVAYARSRA